MARLKIDKDEKRVELALKAYDFISTKGIDEFTINNFLKYLNMGKSALYHYFKTKEEIITEMLYLFIYEAFNEMKEKIQKADTLKQKLDIYFEFYLVNSNDNMIFRELYRMFLFTNIKDKTPNLKKRENEMLELFHTLLKQILVNSTENQDIQNLTNSLMATADGMLVYSFVFEEFDLSSEIRIYLDSFIRLIENKRI